ncbi:DNA repair protein RecO [Mangrovimicrobium sediminis]|uniref:DNA repair protein RecO n=1 Tax=Mangrovimicrobium sediminis TaxID=2562682 RepID=A0A4Z0M5E7_9GAMM|nr:DNA repair protein RecO [Haliea sp. SAOS-164]TGD74666.1 DNA repair protein RecO [Haliea sp. SAOS-164]
MRAQLQPAYILHQRPYRDTSLLLEVFTATQGRISLVGKGVRRRARGGSVAALLQPFTPLLLSFSGRSELKNLNQVEPAGAARALRGDFLFSGMYLNELLVRLLHRNDPHPALFAAYGLALEALERREEMDGVLRRFELGLLDELGYSFSLVEDGRSGEPLDAQAWYGFESDVGLVRAAPGAAPVFHGGDLLAAAQGDFGGAAGQTAKRLMRLALAAHLGDTPLHSRELFRARRAAPVEDG